jgi:hypothetical protein
MMSPLLRPDIISVMPRAIAVLMTLWCTWLGPSLCAGGVLSHLCECLEPTCCADCQSGPCQDEHGCPDDPCRLDVARNDGPGTALPSPVDTPAMVLPVEQIDVPGLTALAAVETWRHALFDPLQTRNLPLLV